MSQGASRRPALHHFNLKTTRLDAMTEWYAEVVGMDVIFRGPVSAFLSNDRANHRMALLAWPGLSDDPGKADRTGLHHVAFEYESFDDLMADYARLRDRGIVPDHCLDHGITTALFYLDPDRNLVELQVDNFPDWDASTAWMRASPAFAANPVGAYFDAERVFQAHAAGAPFSAIQPRVYAGEFAPAQRQQHPY